MTEPIDYQARLKQALAAMQKMRSRLETLERSRSEPIAVIGIGCRLPGGVRGAEAYWQLLHNGVDAVTEVPPERWDMERYYDPDPNAPGKMYTRHGGFLDGLDQFDPQFFGIAPREVSSMDPQQRLFLEVAWEALEHANLPPDKLAGSKTGVFVGVTASDYMQLHAKYADVTDINAYLASGNVFNVVSGRLSYTLGLQGPSVSLDTACSSSMTAIHLACQSIRTGDSHMAIAGGVNVMLVPEIPISFSKWGMLSAAGRCRTFDAGADGFVRGEGCGVVVLKSLSAALADGDHILAVIRGSAINQDGASSSLSTPNGLAQEDVIRLALADAGVYPQAVRYVETHGTGTTLGDPIEVEALGNVLGRHRPANQPLVIGSVKTNIGHLEAASGVAGFIKTVLALYHEEIPPHLHLTERSPYINWAELPIDIPTQPIPWPRDEHPRLAGVSSFGFSGTNVHVILEEAPRHTQVETPRPEASSRPTHLLTLSAKTEPALRHLARSYGDYLDDHPDVSLAEAGATTRRGRSHFNHRLGIVAATAAEASEKLAAFANGQMFAGVVSGQRGGHARPKVAFLFPGQGPQYVGMGRQLYETELVFRNALDRCDELLKPLLNISIASVIFGEPGNDTSRLTIDDTLYTQPALFAVEYALAELWRSWGVEPDAVLGHSMGEYVAACVAGIFSLEDGLKLIAARSQLMQALPLNGAMAVIFANQATVEQVKAGFGDKVSIAAINGPENTVISGLDTAIDELLERFQSIGIKVRRLSISHASHSGLMEPMLDEFEVVAASKQYSSPRIPLVSNLTGKWVGDNEYNAAYLRRHIRQPVRFAESIALLYERGYRIFLEPSPTPTLLSMGERCVPEGEGSWLPSLRKDREDWQQILQSASVLYTHGVPIDWDAFDAGTLPLERSRQLKLPTYPFQRQRYWLEMKRPRYTPETPAGHPLLGRRLRSPAVREPVFESKLNRSSPSFLADHQVLSLVVVPATAYVEMALAAATNAFGEGMWAIEDVIIHEALILSGENECAVQLILSGDAEAASFKIFSLRANESDEDEWQLHASGNIGRSRSEPAEVESQIVEIRSRCQEEMAIDDFYQDFSRRGIDFGSGFRGVVRLRRGEGEALGEIRLPASLEGDQKGYHFHPALMDACWQVFSAAWEQSFVGERDTYMPVNLTHFRLYRPPGKHLWSHARLRPTARDAQPTGGRERETIIGDISVFDDSGRLVAEVEGLLAKRATSEALHRALRTTSETWRDWLYEVQWQREPLSVDGGGQSHNAAAPVTPAGVANKLQPRAAELITGHDLATTAELLPQLDSLSVEYIILALNKLGWSFEQASSITLDSLARVTGVVPRHHDLLRRMLGILVEANHLRADNDTWEIVSLPSISEPRSQLAALQARFPAYAGEIILFDRCAAQLAEVLRGDVDPLELLFPAGEKYTAEYLYGAAPTAQMFNTLLAETVSAVASGLSPGKTLRILEIGAGTGGSTSAILPLLPSGKVEYTFTDVSNLFLVKAREKFGRYSFMNYRLLDIERDPASQGYTPGEFDLIIAANVLHATQDLRQTMAHTRQLLAPDGFLAILEGVAPRRWIDLTFGMTSGWWRFIDKALRPSHPLLSPAQWRQLMVESAFGDVAAVPEPDTVEITLFPQAVMLAAAAKAIPERRKDAWLIFSDERGEGVRLAETLRHQGNIIALVTQGESFDRIDETHWQVNPAQPDDFRRLLSEVTGSVGALQNVVHLWSLDVTVTAEDDPTKLVQGIDLATGSALHLAQALAAANLPGSPRLWFVTQGANSVAGLALPQPAQAPVWGFGKIISLEHAEIYGGCIELDPALAVSKQLEELLADIRSPIGETQVAYRLGKRYVARLVRSEIAAKEESVTVPNRQPVQLHVASPGILDSLELRPLLRRTPGPGEVEVEIFATGLNFRDVLNAMAMYPGDAGPLGGECAGRISAVGGNVIGFRPGDEVIAIAPGSLGSFVVTQAVKVVHKPARLSFVEAATVLSAFLTAYYTLNHRAGMKSGERVLIQAAAGGVGMAAVQLAQRAGAEIFATAGSQEKRALLRSLGVQHVMNSRTVDFSNEIKRITGGRGVDIVLNSLADDFIPHSLSSLAKDGRFIEIGKRGIWTADQVAELVPDATYHVIDLVAEMDEDPALIQSIIHQIIDWVDSGELGPLPNQTFPLEEAAAAFRTMAQAKHTGKIVITQPETGNTYDDHSVIRQDGAYLITGGLTGLGLLAAEQLVEQGARYLALMGRRPPSDSAREAIQRMERDGAKVMVIQADVSRKEQLNQALADIEADLPVLRGIIHSAGVLDDGALLQQTWERFQTVFAPKVDGGYLLHALTRHLPLEFFVLFSSASAVLGSPGQSNHAAANAFLDALAYHRRGLGLPALSINWGVWDQIGAAAERSVGGRVSTRGIGTISPNDGWQALWHLLQRTTGTAAAAAQVGVFPVDWAKFLTGTPSNYFSALATRRPRSLGVEDRGETRPNKATVVEPTGQPTPLRQRLEEAPNSKRRSLILAFVRDEANKVLGLLPAQTIDQLQPLQELGLDSLMAVELRNLLGSHLELDHPLPATLVFDYPSVDSLASYLMKEIFHQDGEDSTTHSEPNGEQERKIAELEALSEAEAEALLLAELAAMKGK